MVLPALLYLAVTAGTAGASGWGAAMPTDIAVAAAVLALAWPRSSPGVRVFLLSLAIADDIGSVAVVALAYPSDLAWGWLGVAALVGVVIAALQRIHVRATVVYVALGVGMWLAVREAGVSPTLAGVVLGFLTPAEPFQRPRAVSDEAHRVADATLDFPPTPDADAPQWLRLAGLSREAVSPLARVEAALHPWTSYVVVPLFALANAGVVLSAAALDGAVERRVALGILVGRLVGKPLGIALACTLAIRIGAARHPPGGRLPLFGLGMAAAVPFTVSLFIAELALPGRLLDAAKLGIFSAAVVAGIAGFVVLRAQRRSGARASARSDAG